jgi:hypothetical protein
VDRNLERLTGNSVLGGEYGVNIVVCMKIEANQDIR